MIVWRAVLVSVLIQANILSGVSPVGILVPPKLSMSSRPSKDGAWPIWPLAPAIGQVPVTPAVVTVRVQVALWARLAWLANVVAPAGSSPCTRNAGAAAI